MKDGLHEQDVVVAAACRSERLGGLVFVGVRHFCPLMHGQMEKLVKVIYGENYTTKDWHGYLGPLEEGFVSNRYKFLTREEAYQMAVKAGQMICPRGNGHSEEILFSEGVW